MIVLRASRLSSLPRSPLFWILLVGAILRVAFFLQVRGEPTCTVPQWDEAVYDEMARSVAAGHGVGLDKAYFFDYGFEIVSDSLGAG